MASTADGSTGVYADGATVTRWVVGFCIAIDSRRVQRRASRSAVRVPLRSRHRRPGGTCLSPARDDDAGRPRRSTVRPAPDGHDQRRQPRRRRRAPDRRLPGPHSRTCRPGDHDAGSRSRRTRSGLGMFAGSGDFVPPDVIPALARAIEIVVDGVLHDLSGDRHESSSASRRRATRSRDAEAFGAFWASLSDLTWPPATSGVRCHTSPICTPVRRRGAGRRSRHPARRRDLGRSSNPSRRWASRRILAGTPLRDGPRCGRRSTPTQPGGGEPVNTARSTRAPTGPTRRPSRSARWCRRERLSRGVRPVRVEPVFPGVDPISRGAVRS